MEVTLNFDGACEPVNPGGTGTYGFVIRGLPGLGAIPGGGVAGSGQGMTNNVAEYTALLRGLKALDAVATLGPDDVLVLRGDSKLVVNQLTGSWRCNHAHLAGLRDECRELLKGLGCQWRAEWVPREENAEADALSVEAYVQATGKPFPVRKR